MGLATKRVIVKWNSSNKKHYENLGYIYTKIGDEFEVKIEDLTKGSNIKVNCKCDHCGKDLVWVYNDYNHQVKENGETYCKVCANQIIRRNKEFSKSFYDWCIEQGRQDALDRWDYELNNCSPKEVGYSTHKKYYFKCLNSEKHVSELKGIGHFTAGCKKSLDCIQCNSVAQYILDNFPNKDLYEVWDKDKNIGINPWQINKKTNKKVWIKCQNKNYHDSYETMCSAFTNGSRCPYCASKKVHQKDSLGQYIIDNYGEEFLNKIWSNKNNVSPFEVSAKSNKKIWWGCCEYKHEDYLRSCCDSFESDFRCPKCSEFYNRSIIENKTKSHLEELGYCVLTEYDCTLKPVNPKTKMPMPYDNEIVLHNGEHLIIEVHGEQHYKSKFYGAKLNISKEKAEDMLKQRKLYDRYKKYIAWKNGYEYLELPYTAFRGKNKDLYKQMIDNKIKEILEKEEIA